MFTFPKMCSALIFALWFLALSKSFVDGLPHWKDIAWWGSSVLPLYQFTHLSKKCRPMKDQMSCAMTDGCVWTESNSECQFRFARLHQNHDAKCRAYFHAQEDCKEAEWCSWNTQTHKCYAPPWKSFRFAHRAFMVGENHAVNHKDDKGPNLLTDSASRLIQACEMNNMVQAQALLESGVDVTIEKGKALSVAYWRGYEDLLQMLLRYRAESPKKGKAPLEDLMLNAVTRNEEDHVLLFHHYGANVNSNQGLALLIALQLGYPSMVSTLVEKLGANPAPMLMKSVTVARRTGQKEAFAELFRVTQQKPELLFRLMVDNGNEVDRSNNRELLNGLIRSNQLSKVDTNFIEDMYEEFSVFEADNADDSSRDVPDLAKWSTDAFKKYELRKPKVPSLMRDAMVFVFDVLGTVAAIQKLQVEAVQGLLARLAHVLQPKEVFMFLKETCLIDMQISNGMSELDTRPILIVQELLALKLMNSEHITEALIRNEVTRCTLPIFHFLQSRSMVEPKAAEVFEKQEQALRGT